MELLGQLSDLLIQWPLVAVMLGVGLFVQEMDAGLKAGDRLKAKDMNATFLVAYRNLLKRLTPFVLCTLMLLAPIVDKGIGIRLVVGFCLGGMASLSAKGFKKLWSLRLGKAAKADD